MGHKQTMMRLAKVKTIYDTVRRTKDGMTVTEIAAATGIKKSTVNDMLAELRKAGKLEPTLPQGGNGNKWGRIGIRAQYLIENAEKVAILQRKAHLAALAKQRRIDEERIEAEFEQPCVHRIVPAHLAAPLRPQGPASVWALAA